MTWLSQGGRVRQSEGGHSHTLRVGSFDYHPCWVGRTRLASTWAVYHREDFITRRFGKHFHPGAAQWSQTLWRIICLFKLCKAFSLLTAHTGTTQCHSHTHTHTCTSFTTSLTDTPAATLPLHSVPQHVFISFRSWFHFQNHSFETYS
jgi:hypothetical protein